LLRVVFIFCLLFSYSVAYSNENLNNVNVKSLNILNGNEINNFLNNKLISGFFSDGENFREAYYSNSNYLFEMLSGQNKGKYEGKWKIIKNSICYLMQGSSNYDCTTIYWKKLKDGNYDIYFGDQQSVFAKITQIEDAPKNNLNNLLKGLGNLTSNQSISNQNQTQSTPSKGQPPQGTQNLSQEDIVNIDLNSYPISPSDKSLNQLNFNMTRDKVVEVLKNNGCKITANWKRRVITKGQKDSRDLKSKCFKKKMIVIGFEKNGVMEFIADTHYLGNDNKQHFIEDYDQNKSRVRIESFQRYAPNKIYNIGSNSVICLNEECMEMVYRSALKKEIAFLYLNPKSTIAKEWAKKSIGSFKLAIERPGNGCIVQENNPCLIFKAKYVDPSIKYLDMFMNGKRTPERESLRQMYINYVQAQILAAEALGLTEVASDLKLLLDYIVSDPAELDTEDMIVRISKGTNELYKNVNKGSNNEEANKKIEEAHVYAAKAGNEGQLFFKAVTAIFSSGSFEEAVAATEVASRTKGNLNYFYKALREIREAKNVNLTPETKEEFGAAEDSIEI
jgi:hypothetical protein